jgi:hypothetical protein
MSSQLAETTVPSGPLCETFDRPVRSGPVALHPLRRYMTRSSASPARVAGLAKELEGGGGPYPVSARGIAQLTAQPK